MTKVTYDPNKLPIAVLIVAEAAKSAEVTFVTKADVLSAALTTGETLTGREQIVRYLARVHDRDSAAKLYGECPYDSTMVDVFVEMSRVLINKDALSQYAGQLNNHLESRTYLVGHNPTIADFVCWESLTYNMRWTAFNKESSKYPHLFRWYSFVASLPISQPGVKAYHDQQQQVKQKWYQHSKSGNFGVELPGAEMGKVVTRFPPEPSGYLHIGHAKAALLNFIIAQEWGGKMILRFDDTNPMKEKEEYVNSIFEDLRTLGVSWATLTHSSDYFDLIYDYATQMIKSGKAYVDDTPVDQMRKERMDGIESKHRNNSVEENLRLWKEMTDSTELGQTCCLRAKIDMQALNKAMRDPVMYRCNLTPHHRTGTKYKLYPTYDFTCPIVDSIEGVTHALRTNEYHDRDPQYYWMIDALGLRKPVIRDYSRLNFVYTTLSKRKLTWFVNEGLVEGWDDPRFPTVRGIIRRGMTVDALKRFIVAQGFSKSVNLMEWDKIWTFNKQVLDPEVPRYNAVSVENKCVMKLTNISSTTVASVPLHPKNPATGTKHSVRSNEVLIEQDDAQLMQDGEEVTLMSWGNAIVKKIQKDDKGNVTLIEAEFNPQGDFKKTEKKLNWVGDAADDTVPLTLLEFDHLLTVPKVEEDMDFNSVVNKNNKFETAAVGESALRNAQKGVVVQLQRRGFFIVDRPYVGPGKPMVMLLVPDGKSTAISTLSSKGRKL